MGQPAKVNWGLGYRGAESTGVHQKGLSHFVQGSTSKSGAKEACQECNNMKLRQEVLKHGCAAGTRKETDRCIINCVRPSKKQHRMCSWFCGKVGHKKVKCFAREKSRNMTKKVNEETSGEGCSSVESNLEVDQEASNLELGHEVVCGTKEKEIERALGVDGEGLMVKKMTHDGSKVLNISWSKGSSTGASGHDAILGENGDVLVQSMHISWGRKSWCGAHLVGEKSTFCVEVSSAMRRALDLTLAEKKMNLAEWALNCYKKGMLDQIVDPFLKGKITPECFKKFAEINRYEMCTRPGHRETVYGRCSVELRVRVAASGKRGREREGDMDEDFDGSEDFDGLALRDVFSQILRGREHIKKWSKRSLSGSTSGRMTGSNAGSSTARSSGTRKETDRCIINCVRPSKKQHRMCSWFCGKVGHKKVKCFAREKSRNMTKKVNKTFIKPKRVEEVLLVKSGLLDEVMEETSGEGCSSVESDLEVDQEASNLELGHEVFCGTKEKEIEVRQEVMRDDLQEGDSEITPRQ
ncbi:hypothetical protein F2Q68_00022119 [Brassica cretica]|uniref:CCHC-type domain-containing protein n=1 Tax=Brassica cretica TaxID=69181 RepID=A0A8S9G075_BRACR|nr:hypothetical protein F2Q68_00022119 [Brassica cretica]